MAGQLGLTQMFAPQCLTRASALNGSINAFNTESLPTAVQRFLYVIGWILFPPPLDIPVKYYCE